MALTPRSLRLDAKADPCWAGYEQVGMKRKGGRRVPNCVPTQSRAAKDTEDDGKKYSKVVTNPETGRKNKVRYGAKGYKIAPGTDKGDRYCARSFGDMKSEGYDCSGAERNTPLCLSRAKWKCSGKTSRRDAASRACGQSHIAAGKTCHKKGAFPTGKAIAAGLTAGAVGAALLHKGSRKAILGAPTSARRAAQGLVTEAVHRATAPKPSMRLTPKAFNQARYELKRSGMAGGMRRHNLTLEALRRKTEPGYRKPRFPERKDNYIAHYAPVLIDPTKQRNDAEVTPGKVLGLARVDAPEGGRGKPCGESHIPRTHKCSKSAGSLTVKNLQTAATVAVGAGLVAGGLYLSTHSRNRQRPMTSEEWANSPLNARNNPKVSPERAAQLYDEAVVHGRKWDVQEKINARRLSELQAECGGVLGKIQAPAKFDAAISTPRCQAGAGAFGTYFVHSSEQYGLKVFRNADFDADPGWEFDRLGRAHAAGVNVPEPLAINYTKDGTHVLTLRHLKGYREITDLYAQGGENLRNAPLIIQVKLAREFRKLHTEGLSHGDIHGGNVMVNPKAKRVALVDFGYSTHIDDDAHPIHSRNGIRNLMLDLYRLPEYLGLPRNGYEFLSRNKGVLANIEKQANNYSRSWNNFELGIKRFYDALESDLMAEDRMPRSRFISGADQPRLPGLTRRILTANANTRQRAMMAQVNTAMLQQGAKNLGVKPARLFLALKPERDVRLAGRS